jgi:hypothetical protein
MEVATNSKPGRLVEEIGNGKLEIFDLDTSEAFLTELLTDLFTNYWNGIQFGTLIQGAVYEFKASQAPVKVSSLDGYLTVDFGTWHFHICIGENKGTKRSPISSELAYIRKTSRAELYRRLNPDGSIGGWGLRLFNGQNENQLTVFLPGPFLSDELKFLKEPDWSRLALWDYLRQKYLGLAPEAVDRSGKTMFHK